MRKFFLSIFTALLALGFVGCEYDDSGLWNEVNSLKDRVLTLEQLCQQMNTNISSLQKIVEAMQNNDYVTNVAPITEDGKVVGYVITFLEHSCDNIGYTFRNNNIIKLTTSVKRIDSQRFQT